ncbi:SH3 domain-containing protein [Larkinella soli]|uniref:SH3 domain-containing protein n=1 Tax=Larkinella soli TaxID=1770527 RepID=UPI000FFBC841|nr:SH3 domain-containing protein [Larkinella soli]
MLILCGIRAEAQSPAGSLKLADSLFAAGEYERAGTVYEQHLGRGYIPTDPMLLKMAYIQEKQGDIAKLLYYLQVYFDRRPNEQVLKKMHEIAAGNNLRGYETDDLNYFYLFYKQYGLYVTLALVLLGAYAFGIFWVKFRKGEPTRQRHKLIILLYFTGLLLLVNLPERYQSGIINRDRVLLRGNPSSAAPVVEVISRGHKVNILGSQDVWLRVFWNDGLYYVRRDDVWVI